MAGRMGAGTIGTLRRRQTEVSGKAVGNLMSETKILYGSGKVVVLVTDRVAQVMAAPSIIVGGNGSLGQASAVDDHG